MDYQGVSPPITRSEKDFDRSSDEIEMLARPKVICATHTKNNIIIYCIRSIKEIN